MRPMLALFASIRRLAGVFLLIALVLAVGSVLDLRTLPVDSTFNNLLPQDDPLLERVERYQKILDREVNQDAVLLRLKSPGDVPRGERVKRLLAAGRRVEDALKAHTEIEQASFERNRLQALNVDPLALDEATIDEIEARIDKLRQAVDQDGALPNTEQSLAQVYGGTAEALKQLMSGLAILDPNKLTSTIKDLSDQLTKLNDLNEAVLAALEDLPDRLETLSEGVKTFRAELSSLQSTLKPVSEEASPYWLSEDANALMIQFQPDQPASQSIAYNRRVVHAVKSDLSSLNLESQGITWGIKGPHVFSVQSDNMLRSDMNRTALITVVGVLALFVFVLRRFLYPIIATIPVSIALLLTLAIAKHLFGGLNLLTAFLPAIVLGLGIDYGIQFISHYLELRQGSRRIVPALRHAVTVKGQAMITAATATSLVLFAVGFVSQTTGLSEMGFILGFGVLLSCLMTLVVLPSLLVVGQRAIGRRQLVRPPRPWNLEPFARAITSRPWVVVALVIAGTAAMAWPAVRVDFTFISKGVSQRNLPSQEVAGFINDNFETRGQIADPENYFFFFVEPSLERVREVSNRLYRMPEVNKRPLSYYSAIGIEKPEERARFKRLLGRLRALEPVKPLKQASNQLSALRQPFTEPEALLDALQNLSEQLQSSADNVVRTTGNRELEERFLELKSETDRIRERFQALVDKNTGDRLFALQQSVDSLIERVRSLQAQLPTPERIDQLIENPPEQYRKLGFAPDGDAIVAARVKEDVIWNSDRYNAFIDKAKRISDEVFGVPMTRSRLETYMRQDFAYSTAAAGVIIMGVLWLTLRRSRMRGGTWLSLITLGLGYLWMLGALYLLEIDFNVANILISPLLIGLGVDNCVYLLARFRDMGGRSIADATASTALPILANTLATMIGFGSLILAQTPILEVLGQSAVLGIGFMALFSLTFLPAAMAIRR
ncbi:MAG: RND family transporter [Candidatus Bipolaricaulia bacterium]